MKKILGSLSIMLIVLLLVSGCQRTSAQLNLKLVEISKYQVDNQSQTPILWSTSNTQHKELLTLFDKILSESKRNEGIVNMMEPEYFAQLTDTNQSQMDVYLWLSSEGLGSLMKADDTHTIYVIPQDLTEALVALLGLD